MYCSPIAVSSFCWGAVKPAKWSVTLCVVGGSVDSGDGVRAISMPSSSRCCSRHSAQPFGVSSIEEISGPPLNLLQCDFWCFCGTISIPVVILAASFDCRWVLWMIASLMLL